MLVKDTYKRELVIDGIYRYFKGGYYRVLALMGDSDINGKITGERVIYQDLELEGPKKISSISYDLFMSTVDVEKYPDSKQNYVMEYIGNSIVDYLEEKEMSLTCPVCGGETKIYDSRTIDEGSLQVRRRKCLDCYYTFKTYEMDEDFYKQCNERLESKMTINEYQKEALRTESGMHHNGDKVDRLLNGLMGLNGEAGEAIDLLKKHFYQGHELDEKHIAKELGDVAWYIAISADAIGYDLETILQMNVDKLRKRYPNGFEDSKSKNRKAGDI